jgi:hypothetical protein
LASSAQILRKEEIWHLVPNSPEVAPRAEEENKQIAVFNVEPDVRVPVFACGGKGEGV